jgi:hypothetical protein
MVPEGVSVFVIEAGKQEYECVDVITVVQQVVVGTCVADSVGHIVVKKNCMRVPRFSTSLASTLKGKCCRRMSGK